MSEFKPNFDAESLVVQASRQTGGLTDFGEGQYPAIAGRKIVKPIVIIGQVTPPVRF